MSKTVTTKEFAELLGVSKCTVAGYCLGENGMPKIKTPGKKEVKFDLDECFEWAVKNDKSKLAYKIGEILASPIHKTDTTTPRDRPPFHEPIRPQIIVSDNGTPFHKIKDQLSKKIHEILASVNVKLDGGKRKKRCWKHYSRVWKSI